MKCRLQNISDSLILFVCLFLVGSQWRWLAGISSSKCQRNIKMSKKYQLAEGTLLWASPILFLPQIRKTYRRRLKGEPGSCCSTDFSHLAPQSYMHGSIHVPPYSKHYADTDYDSHSPVTQIHLILWLHLRNHQEYVTFSKISIIGN